MLYLGMDANASDEFKQKMKSYMKKRLDFAETAMLSGRGLPGFKCMYALHMLKLQSMHVYSHTFMYDFL
jgi:hypothetical protein